MDGIIGIYLSTRNSATTLYWLQDSFPFFQSLRINYWPSHPLATPWKGLFKRSTKLPSWEIPENPVPLHMVMAQKIANLSSDHPDIEGFLFEDISFQATGKSPIS